MVRVVDCHARDLGSNRVGPKRVCPLNCFNGVRSNSVAFSDCHTRDPGSNPVGHKRFFPSLELL